MDLMSTVYTVVFQPDRLTKELLTEIHAVGHFSTSTETQTAAH